MAQQPLKANNDLYMAEQLLAIRAPLCCNDTTVANTLTLLDHNVWGMPGA